MVRQSGPVPLSLLMLAACASADTPGSARRPEVRWAELWPELARPDAADGVGGEGAFPARRPDEASLQRLADAERLWRAKDEGGFAAARDQLAEEPIEAFWLARMLIRDALFHRENARADTSAMVGPPPWQRAVDQLVAMGGAAAPCVVLDLMRQRSVDRRGFGAEILAAMGPSALPVWERTLDVADPLVRRYAVQAASGWQGDAHALELLLHGTGDADFGVRAQAWRGVAASGDGQGGRLRSALAVEDDRFVRRAIVDGLGMQPDLASAAAVIDYLEQAIADRDSEGIEAANRALMQQSGRTAPDSVVGWRRWLDGRRSDGG